MSAETFNHLNTVESWHKLHETTSLGRNQLPKMKSRNMAKRLKGSTDAKASRVVKNLIKIVHEMTDKALEQQESRIRQQWFAENIPDSIHAKSINTLHYK